MHLHSYGVSNFLVSYESMNDEQTLSTTNVSALVSSDTKWSVYDVAEACNLLVPLHKAQRIPLEHFESYSLAHPLKSASSVRLWSIRAVKIYIDHDATTTSFDKHYDQGKNQSNLATK